MVKPKQISEAMFLSQVLIKNDPQESQIKEIDKISNLVTIYLSLF